MSVYKKGAGLLRVVYKSNLKTAPKKVSVIGKYYPFNDGLDAYQWFEVEGLPATPTEKEFLEGNPDRLSYYVPSDVTDIIPPLGVLFPNCTVYVVGNTEQVVSGLPDADATAIVPNTLKSSYLADPVYSTYQNLTFDSWILQNETTIPFVGNATLTASFVRLFYENAGGIASTVGKIIVAPDYTDFEAGVFDLIFALFVNCQEIEYGGLPSAYQEVEYIESTGTQWIDTGFKPNQDTKVEMSISDTAALAYWYGAWNASYQEGAYCFCNDTSWLYLGYANQSAGKNDYYTLDSLPHIIRQDKNICYVDDVLLHSFSYQQFQGLYNLYLFGQNRAGTAFPKGSFRLISCKLYDNGTLVRYFVPCYRKSDGEIGLYDTVNNQFYTNQGTGVFLKGNDTTSPADVTETLTRPALATATIVGSGTLTAQKVADTLTAYPEFASAERVVVPVDFTEYESGSIQAIKNAFTSMVETDFVCSLGTLEVKWSEKEWTDVFAKLTEMDKNFGDCLSYMRQHDTSPESFATTPSMACIFPPLGNYSHTKNMNSLGIALYVVYANIKGTVNVDRTYPFQIFGNCQNLVSARIECDITNNVNFMAYDCWSLKNFYIKQTNNAEVNTSYFLYSQSPQQHPIIIENFVWENQISPFAVGYKMNYDTLTHDSLVEWGTKIGTPATAKTLYIGANNIAKLSAEEQALFTDKNWVLQ